MVKNDYTKVKYLLPICYLKINLQKRFILFYKLKNIAIIIKNPSIKMRRNMSLTDRLIHVAVALVFCFLCSNGIIRGRTDVGFLLFLAVILAFSSLFGVSPVYWLFGFSTYNEMQDD
jgi:hypothetical protein